MATDQGSQVLVDRQVAARTFWTGRVERLEAELRDVNAGRGDRQRNEVERDLTKALRMLREIGQ
jgi:hypothetical protein